MKTKFLATLFACCVAMSCLAAGEKWEYAELQISTREITPIASWSDGTILTKAKGGVVEAELLANLDPQNAEKHRQSASRITLLNFIGSSGWELTAIRETPAGVAIYVFKRPSHRDA